jgi:gamma-D-glutamyl-L-lysine dipeptidyl-peptidase
MDHAMIIVPAAPVRRKARHQSEMTNQLLFGETVKVIKQKGSLWAKVRSTHDDYEGWITSNLLKEINAAEVKRSCDYVAADLLNTIRLHEQVMQLPIGSSLPGFAAGQGSIHDLLYLFSGKYIHRKELKPGADLVKQLTHAWLNAPYLWGGRTIFGVDCSGFVQVNFKMMGIDLPRDAWQQAQGGSAVKKLKEAVCGDLAFFDDKEEIVHVGILLGEDKIIHASGKVRIDTIDKKGIINSDTDKRTHSLKAIRRFW